MLKTYTLFAVFGTSGAGKSTLLKIIQKIYPEATIHKKYTDRKRRRKEKLANYVDLKFVKVIDTSKCILTYFKYKHYYGIRKDLLEKAHRDKEMHFIIIRDISAIRRMKSMHPEIKTIYVHTDPGAVTKHLQLREGISAKERIERIKGEYLEFVQNNTLFDYVVVNFWDLDNALIQLQSIINRHHKLAAEFLG